MTTPPQKRPVASWLEYDYSAEEHRALPSLTVILRTRGCYWRKCTMCGFWYESAAVPQADIMAQLEHSLQHSPGDAFILKIFTSGSFLDEREISSETRKRIAALVKRSPGLKKLIVETRPEFITSDKIEDLKDVDYLELAIGLETADDFIRSTYINKGFSFDDYTTAARIVAECGATVKTYLLLKPPFISEQKALEDVIKSAERTSPYSSSLSVNLCNVQKYTLLEKLWKRGYYRPPWLWTTVEAIKEIAKRNIVVMSDPVGAGHERGPHNCGKCDPEIRDAIKTFNSTQNVSILERLGEFECDCKGVWHALLKYNEFLFGSDRF